MAIIGQFHFNVNARDAERSRDFFEKVGFKVSNSIGGKSDRSVEKGLIGQPYLYKGYLMVGGPVVLDLIQWLNPLGAEIGPKGPTQFGIIRVAFETDDVEGDYARMKAAGIDTFFSEPIEMEMVRGGPVKWVAFKDPDGNIFQLVERGKPQ